MTVKEALDDMLSKTVNEVIEQYGIDWLWNNIIFHIQLEAEEYQEFIGRNYGTATSRPIAKITNLNIMRDFIETWKKKHKKLTLVDKLVKACQS
jgi:hypothetical protein